LRNTLKVWILVGLALVVVAGLGWGIYDRYRPQYETPAELMALLPRSDAVLFFADVRVIRETGLLAKVAGSKAVEESDYQRFVAETHFDYQKDIDAIAAVSLPAQTFAVVRGRFDWKRLSKYATQHGGKCHNSYCQLPASKQDQWISFFPVRKSVMAIAVSPDPSAAYMLLPRRSTPDIEVPNYAVWVSLPRRVITGPTSLPPAAQLLVSAMSGASSVVVGIEGGSSGPGNRSKLNLRLDAKCDSPAEAAKVEGRLQDLTRMANSLTGGHSDGGNAGDLGTLLASGTLSRAGDLVKGTWPIRQQFLDSLMR
jgi:hypothetical protein